jgi:hypothetical protein
MANGFCDTSYDFRVGGAFNGFLFQVVQELVDLALDLPSGSGLPVFIVGFKQAR